MTKKHFKALAVHLAYSYEDESEREKAAFILAEFCQGQNPRFNRALFIEEIEQVARETHKQKQSYKVA